MANAQGCEESSSRGPVDHLTEALDELELDSDVQAVRTDQMQQAVLSEGNARSCLRPAANKENKESAVAPSSLACFKQLRDELTCAVCLDICIRPCTTPCGHSYCRSCLRRNTELNRPCPKCRANLPPGFALTINTTLWNTIQHLFPAEANSKPLTPPPAQAQSQQQPVYGQATSRRSGSNGNPAAAPFRPPRFVALAAGDPVQAAFSGHSSSRANAAGRASMGLASLAGRSVSGPRPQRPPSSSSSSGGGPAGAAVQPAVFSLADLGVRPAREGGAGRRDRRRSRSAERWEGAAPLLLSSSDEEDSVRQQLAQRPAPAGRAHALPHPSQLSSSASGLLHLLSGAPRSSAAVGAWAAGRPPQAPPRTAAQARAEDRSSALIAAAAAAAPGAYGGRRSTQPPAAAAVSGPRLSNNPFRRPCRPALAPTAAATAAVAPTPAGAALSAATSQFVADPRGSVAAGGDTAAAVATARHFTASQRALLSACTSAQAAADALAALGRRDGVGLRVLRTISEVADPVSEGAVAPLPRAGSGTSQSSASCSSGSGSARSTLGSWSARVMDDVSELELLPETGSVSRLQPYGKSGLTAAPNVAAAAALRSGAEQSAGAAAAVATAGAVLQVRPRPPLCVAFDSDVSLEELDEAEPGPPERTRAARRLVVSPFASPHWASAAVPPPGTAATPDAQSSPSWSELDARMARALEPLHISPPSLPRLRVPARQGAAVAGSQDAPSDCPSAAGDAPDGNSNSVTPRATSAGRHHMDPDLAENYDGEDPAGADSFFSSPFFDRKLLLEGLQEAAEEDSDVGGSEAAFSPRSQAERGDNDGDAHWRKASDEGCSPFRCAPPADLAAGSGRIANAHGATAVRLIGAETYLLPGRGDSGGAVAAGPAQGVGLRTTSPVRANELAQRASGLAAQVQGSCRLHAGDGPDCPIELLSDSDQEGGRDDAEDGLGVVGFGRASGSRALVRSAAGQHAPPAESSQCVVPGLRRLQRRRT